LLRKQPLTPADIASQIEADKEIISQCIRELLEDEDLKAENGIISLKA
jgi:ATP-dependent DNA helicase RecQ